MIHLSSGWFGGRPSHAAEQLRRVAEMGLPGLALLSGNPSPGLAGASQARRETQRRFVAVAWDAVLPKSDSEARIFAADPGPSGQPKQVGHISAAFRALQELGADLLIVSAGGHEDPELRERDQRLLGRLRAGEIEAADDEAVEELRVALVDSQARARAERQLETLARFLFALGHAAPNLKLALALGPTPAGLLSGDSMTWLMEDPALSKVGYWHQVGVAAARADLGLEPPGFWLDRFAGRMLGAGLEDYTQGRDGLLPGEGETDFRLLSEYLPRQALRVLSLAPAYSGEAVLEACQALEAVAIR